MVRLIRFSVYHPWAVLSLITLSVTCTSLFIPGVHLKLDARSLVPSTDPAFTESDAATNLFGLRDVIIVGVVNEKSGVYNPETLAQVRRLSNRISSTYGVIASSTLSIATVPNLTVKNNKIDMRPLLTNGESDYPEAALRVRQGVESLGLNDGILVAGDGQAAAIFSQIRPDANRYTVLEQVRELVAQESNADASVYLSGTALAQAVLGRASAQDLARLVPLVVIVLGIALSVAFRSLVPAILSLLEIGLSLLLTLGVMGLSGQSIFVTTLILPVILVSVGVSDDVYALKHYFVELRQSDGASPEELVINVFRNLIRPIGLTTISTTVGLLSLTVTGLEPLMVFGLFGSVAIIFSTLLTFTLIPSLLSLIGPRRFQNHSTVSVNSASKMPALFRIPLVVGPGRILILTIVVAVCAALLTFKLRVDDNWIRNLPAKSDVAIGDRALNRILAGTTTIDLMIDSGQNQGFLEPRFILAMATIEQAAMSIPYVGATQSLYGEVLRLNASLRGMTYGSYRTALLKNELTLNRGEIEQSLHLLAATRRGSLDDWIDKEYRRARMTVFIRSADYQRIEQVLRTALEAGHNIFGGVGRITPFGDGWISYNTVRVLVEGQTRSIGLALLTDLLVLSLIWKSIKAALIAIIPVAFSVLIIFATLAASGVPLGIATSMFTGITIGIGMDFAIHLTDSYHRGRLLGISREAALSGALVRVGPAVATSAATITLGFLVLTLSQIAPNVQLGLIICLSLTICAISTLVLVPSIVLAGNRWEVK